MDAVQKNRDMLEKKNSHLLQGTCARCHIWSNLAPRKRLLPKPISVFLLLFFLIARMQQVYVWRESGIAIVFQICYEHLKLECKHVFGYFPGVANYVLVESQSQMSKYSFF